MIRFKEYRLKSHLTQKELADKLGVTKSHISDIERGARDPSVRMLIHAATILSTCPCHLLGFSGCQCHHDSDHWSKLDYHMIFIPLFFSCFMLFEETL